MPAQSGGRDLPPEIITEILLRLPVSSVLRSRRVCKQWRNIADDPRFMDEHYRQSRSSQRPSLLLLGSATGHRDRGARPLIFDAVRTTPRYLELEVGDRHTVVGASNGLLCLHKWPRDLVVIANPATGESSALAPPPATGPCACGYMGRFCRMLYSFGFHPATRQFKIVRFPCSNGFSLEFEKVQVYTSGGKTWREVMTPGASRWFDDGAATVGGVTHWVKRWGDEAMSLDLETEEVASIKLPPASRASSPPMSYKLTDVDGRFCVVAEVCRGLSTVEFDVWRLEDAGARKHWSQIYQVCYDFSSVRLLEPHFIYMGHLLLRGPYGRVYACELQEKGFVHIGRDWMGTELRIDRENFESYPCQSFVYTESFARLNI